jgi:hypothetical protein
MPEVRPLLMKELRWALGEQFDAVLESDHIHIEWDPAEQDKTEA